MEQDVSVLFVDKTKISFKAIDFQGRPGVALEVEVEGSRGMIVLDCLSARDIAEKLVATAERSERENIPKARC